ncbi:hypothetical protein PYCC9005_002895 [Savitreella phatthalungensis]
MRRTHSGVLAPGETSGDSPLIALSADCFYGLEEDDDGMASGHDSRFQDLENPPKPPRLVRFLRCRCILPGVPLRKTSRVIVMLKCLRSTKGANNRTSGQATQETIWSRFSRVWPVEDADDAVMLDADSTEPVNALVPYDHTDSLDFTLSIPHDLPQSIDAACGNITYTIQVHANLRRSVRDLSEAILRSQELPIDIPPPESAFTPSRLPKRITTGGIGQALDHFGILITPDISLHVSVPREINYSRYLNSVFKIHIKLMPHPPEAKLPGIRKLMWTLIQTTNFTSAQRQTSIQDSSQSGSGKRSQTNIALVSGDVQLASSSGLAGDDANGMGARKDQYLYIALPENSPDLLPEYEDNRFIEILHTLEIDLYPLSTPSVAVGQGDEKGGNALQRKEGVFGKLLNSISKRRPGMKGMSGPGAATARQSGGTFGRKIVYKASIPIRITIDANEIGRRPQSHASSQAVMNSSETHTSSLHGPSGRNITRQPLAIEAR